MVFGNQNISWSWTWGDTKFQLLIKRRWYLEMLYLEMEYMEHFGLQEKYMDISYNISHEEIRGKYPENQFFWKIKGSRGGVKIMYVMDPKRKKYMDNSVKDKVMTYVNRWILEDGGL